MQRLTAIRLEDSPFFLIDLAVMRMAIASTLLK
jgi:hypothetical protein